MIYLDHAATTLTPPSVEEYVLSLRDKFYNPSAFYRQGVEMSEILRRARRTCVDVIAGPDHDCVFTSGGTEADNTAIFSAAVRGNAVTTLGEHSAVYEPFMQLGKRGVEARFASLNADGSVNVDDLLSKIDEKTSFVSVVHVNNETGAVNDINEIASQVKRINPKILFHSDGVQAYCKLPFTMGKDVDFYSVSGHKLGSYKGVGALIKKKTSPLHPLIYGGGQEGGLRSGTENVQGIASMCEAVRISAADIKGKYNKATELKDVFLKTLCKEIKIISTADCSPYIISLSAEGLKGEVLQHMLEERGIIVGTGSACSSQKRGSRILRAIGYPERILDGVLRVSFGSENTADEIVAAANEINASVAKLSKVAR